MTREAAAAVLITAGASATAIAVTAAVFASGDTSLTPFIPPLHRRIPLNAWTHVAVRLQPADDKATLFVNGTGESRMSSKLSEDFGSAVPAVDLGCMGLLGFVGLMDEVVCTAYAAQPVAPLLALYLLLTGVGVQLAMLLGAGGAVVQSGALGQKPLRKARVALC